MSQWWKKILRSLSEKFNYVVCSNEESKDIYQLSIDELQSSLIVHEEKFQRHTGEEQALKISQEDKFGARGRGRGAHRGRGRGRRQPYNKATTQCFKCHNFGHFQYECPRWDKEANYAEIGEEEEMVLMSYVEMNDARRGDVWFLNSGCNNHMCDDKTLFSDLNENFKRTIKLGNDTKINVLGKAIVRLKVSDFTYVVSEVFFIPELKNNFLSIGQLQEKGLAILIKHRMLKIYHPEKGLIIQIEMSANRMFVMIAKSWTQ